MWGVKPRSWLVVVLAGAAIGLVFAAVSTYDFVQHLDRQVHGLHCSFIPGLGLGTGESGCQIAMMSPYSSVFRTRIWGGIPISLPAMAVFAFISFYAVDLLLTRREGDPRATGFLALACALPAAASLVMLIVSLTKLGTACKLCIGIYLASAVCITGALVLWRRAVHGPALEGPPATDQLLATMFGVGVLFVAVPVALYVGLAPDHTRFVGTCEGLTHPDDNYGVMVPIESAATKGVPALEVLDPLCPACRAFEQRLQASGFAQQLDRKAILFPLDTTCNWMLTETAHPGACTVSEAVLCAGDRAPDVIAWAFEVQDRIRDEAKVDAAAAARIVKQRFPELAACVGSPEAKSRLNKSLRWAVANNIRVLTPQLFVDRVKLCDEDVDLGLDSALKVMLERHDQGTLAASLPTVAPSSRSLLDALRDAGRAPGVEAPKPPRKTGTPPPAATASQTVPQDAGESAMPPEGPAEGVAP
jgi:uncharacterized membrane protein